VDGAHFVLGAYLGWLWCFSRILVRAPSGRQRFNVLGALHAITHQLITVTNESYINATSVCELLEKIAALGLQTPITVVMDNARYQRCRLVFEKATHLGIELLFLPAYSPNLNLIERLWRFVRKECLYSKYYERFEPFKQAITQCLAETTGRHQAALNRLLTLEFQTFESASRDL
jgi:transposase